MSSEGARRAGVDIDILHADVIEFAQKTLCIVWEHGRGRPTDGTAALVPHAWLGNFDNCDDDERVSVANATKNLFGRSLARPVACAGAS